MDDIQIQLRNVRSEIVFIKSFCLAKQKVRTHAVTKVDSDSFGTKVGKLIWKRLRILNTKRKLPKRGAWNIILTDPIISRREAVIDVLQKFDDTKVSGTKKFINEVISTLDFFKAKREAFDTVQNAYIGLADAETHQDITDALIPVISQARAQSDISTSAFFSRIDNINFGVFLKKRKEEASSLHLARTLWPSFDLINSGFSFGSLLTFAATTGGGKSTVIAINLLINFALQGFKVSNVSLEMPKDQITERMSANISGIPLHKIRAFNLDDAEMEHLENSSLLFSKSVAKRGGAYYTLCPDDKDISITEALAIAYEKTPHIILIDYINLLKMPKGVDTKDALSDIAREAKVFASTNNCIVILLAQLNDEERTKYAKAIEEHSDNVIVWSYPASVRPGYIKVKQTKARNQVPYNYYMVEDFATMRVFDMLDPIGLATMLSRSSTKAYIPTTSGYFGLRRLQELTDVMDLDPIGTLKHQFQESIDWDQLITTSVPSPNAPDTMAVIEMVREIVYLIAMYDPKLAQAYLEKIKGEGVLQPYSEFIDELDLPLFAKRQLGLVVGDEVDQHTEKQKLLALLERDLLELSQQAYVDADRKVEEFRKHDITTSRDAVYQDTYDQIDSHEDPDKLLSKKKRKKAVVDPESNESKWVNMNTGYKFHKQLRVDNTPVQITDNHDPLSNIGDSEVKVDKRRIIKNAEKRFEKHWEALASEQPPSLDTMREGIFDGEGLPKPSFLVGFDNAYLKKFEAQLAVVGGFINTKVRKLNDTLPLLVGEAMVPSNDDMREYVASVICKIGSKRIVIDDNYPSIEALTKPLAKKAKGFTSDGELDTVKAVENLAVNLSEIMDPIEQQGKKFAMQQCKASAIRLINPNTNQSVVDSPFYHLYKQPQYIESITAENYHYVDLGFIFMVFKLSEIFQLKRGYENRQVFLRSMVWSLISKENRGNYAIITHLRHCIQKLSKTL